MTTDNVSMTRIRLLLSRFLSDNRRMLLLTVGITFGIFLLVGLFFCKNISDYDLTVTLLMSDAFIFSVFLTIFGSLTFSSMATKSQRISEMMVPASKSEKFLSLLIVYTVGGILLGLVSWFLSAVISAAVFGKVNILFENVSDFLSLVDMKDLGAVLLIGSTPLLGQALYTLGSSLWPKKSFVKTFVALFLIEMMMTFLPFMGIFSRFKFGLMGSFSGWWLVGALYVIIFGIYLLAWVRFRNTQLVQKFMMD